MATNVCENVNIQEPVTSPYFVYVFFLLDVVAAQRQHVHNNAYYPYQLLLLTEVT